MLRLGADARRRREGISAARLVLSISSERAEDLLLHGEIDGIDGSRLTYHANLVTPCPAVLLPGAKIGEKVAR